MRDIIVYPFTNQLPEYIKAGSPLSQQQYFYCQRSDISPGEAPKEESGLYQITLDGLKELLKKREKTVYSLPTPASIFGLQSLQIPFLNHNDGNRISMACSMMRQALPLLHQCSNNLPTAQISEYEQYIEKYRSLSEKSKNEKTKKTISEEPLAPMGKNLLVAYIPYALYNYEDAIVATEESSNLLSTQREIKVERYLYLDEEIIWKPFEKNILLFPGDSILWTKRLLQHRLIRANDLPDDKSKWELEEAKDLQGKIILTFSIVLDKKDKKEKPTSLTLEFPKDSGEKVKLRDMLPKDAEKLHSKLLLSGLPKEGKTFQHGDPLFYLANTQRNDSTEKEKEKNELKAEEEGIISKIKFYNWQDQEISRSNALGKPLVLKKIDFYVKSFDKPQIYICFRRKRDT